MKHYLLLALEWGKRYRFFTFRHFSYLINYDYNTKTPVTNDVYFLSEILSATIKRQASRHMRMLCRSTSENVNCEQAKFIFKNAMNMRVVLQNIKILHRKVPSTAFIA